MNKNELKRHYFVKGSNALKNKKVISIDQDYYCCPICKILLPPEAIESKRLTLEHAPPGKIGGKPLALTCKDCNSIAGYSIDSAVVHRERLPKVITGQVRKRKDKKITLLVGEIELNAILEVDKNTMSVHMEGINDPRKLAAFNNYMKDHSRGEGFKIGVTSYLGYHQKYSKIGDLKSAFIICFALFGYTFALNERLSPIREQIINYKTKVIDRYWYETEVIGRYWSASDPTNINKKHFICLVKKPISAILVKLDKSTIILPWLEGPKDLYKHLKENYKHKPLVPFEGRCSDLPKTLEMNLDFHQQPF